MHSALFSPAPVNSGRVYHAWPANTVLANFCLAYKELQVNNSTTGRRKSLRLVYF